MRKNEGKKEQRKKENKGMKGIRRREKWKRATKRERKQKKG